MKFFLHEFVVFGIKQARACVFAGSFFLLLFLSQYITFGIARYDFIFVGAVLLQALLVLARIETVDEVKVILLFHLIGFVLEVFKTHPSIGSWAYPEYGFFKLFNVPLYSGFMYAAVGSYIAQAWRIFSLRLIQPPSYWLPVGLSFFIYINFFTHHFLPDIRYPLMLAVILIFLKTKVEFTVISQRRSMPLPVSFF